jgi:hypothetical protein
VSDRIAGLLLFLPVPLVLWLFSQQPLGMLVSLAVGIVLTLSHRLYARPFALKGADRRCLWCGGRAGEGPELELREPLGNSRWRCCGPGHHARLSRTLGWAAEHRRWLTAGILGTLAVFLLASGAVVLGWLPLEAGGDAVAFLRLGIALTVLPLGWLGPSRGRSDAAGRPLPFPVHIQALLGTLFVVWLFRLIGLFWLLAGLLHALQRLA